MSALGQTDLAASALGGEGIPGDEVATALGTRGSSAGDQLLLEAIRAAGTDVREIEHAIGRLYNWGFVGNRDVRRALARVGELPEAVQAQVRSNLGLVLDPQGSYWGGNEEAFRRREIGDPIKAAEELAKYRETERERSRKLDAALGDESFFRGQLASQAALADGSMTLEKYRMFRPTPSPGADKETEQNSIRKLWLEMLYPNASSSEIITAIRGTGLPDTPQWIKEGADYAMNVMLRLAMQGPLGAAKAALGMSEIEDIPGNILNLNTAGLTNYTQALGQLLAGEPRISKIYMMREAVRQLDSRINLKEFYQKTKNMPIGAVQQALPYILANDVAVQESGNVVQGVAGTLGYGLAGEGAATLVQSGAEEAQEGTDRAILGETEAEVEEA